MAELIFELGCEELPASQVVRASHQLAQEIQSRLQAAHLTGAEPRVYSTPRRLIVGISDLPTLQPDETKRQRGPSAKASFDASGTPTKALEGFLKGQGCSLEDLETEGDYVWVTKTIPGRPTSQILAEVLPASVQALTFDKTMRWGSGRMRFARPIRWLAALFDGEVVSFSLESLTSGGESRGHRFLSPSSFPVPATLDAFLADLRSRSVEPDAAVREKTIREGIEKAAGGKAVTPDELVDENVHLTEWPMAGCGEFLESYLQLPEPVLVTAMAKHERMFPVKGDDGRLTNRFVFIRNGGEEQRVLSGNAWVLNARFNDARFFFNEDAGLTMDDFLAKTESMTFHHGLGTVRQRADRLEALMRKLAAWVGVEAGLAAKAGLYAKADLSAGLVSELSSLQGVIGGEYAAREGFEPEVCFAISAQYDISRSLPPATSAQKLGALLACCDQLDRLAACLGAGLAPTGSSDPLALRRAATILIEASLAWSDPITGWEEPFLMASSLIEGQGIGHNREEALESLKALFAQRHEAILSDIRYDVRAAAMAGEALLAPRLIRARAAGLALLRSQPSVVQSLTRPLNLVSSAKAKGLAIADPATLSFPEEPAAQALLEASAQAHREVDLALGREDGEAAAKALLSLPPLIDACLEGMMVMVEDEDLRAKRLGLLAAASEAILSLGQVTDLVLEG